MYHSKNSGSTIMLPHNYGGSAFNVKDDEIHSQKLELENKNLEISNCSCQEKPVENPPPGSFLSGISNEDLLLVGLILIIKDANPGDPILMLLLILLLTK